MQTNKNIINKPLYKYYHNIDYAIDTIEKSRIHLENPFYYNDIYDSAIIVNEKVLNNLMSDKIFALVLEYVRKNNYNLGNIVEENFKEMSIGELIRKISKINCQYPSISDKIYEYINKNSFYSNLIIQFSNVKVSCFTEKNDSLLMWSYYANGSKGVCLEFDTNNDFFKLNCHQVEYSNLLKNENDLNNFYRKSLNWEHEKEWRIVFRNDKEYIENIYVKSIYLGKKISENDFELLKNKLINKEINSYLMVPSNVEYKITFDKFTFK